MRFRSFIGGLLIALLASGACSVRDDGLAPGEAAQPQSLSLGVGSESATTKADAGVITEMISSNESPQFRGLSNIRVIPFFTGMGVNVRPTDQANGFSRLFPDIAGSATDDKVFNGHHFHSGLLADSHAHYFSGGNALFSGGTTAMLVYARATEPDLPEEPLALRAHKQLYGSLTEKGWVGEDNSLPTPADIGFIPEPIYGSDIADVATAMAGILTPVASTSVSVPYVYHNDNQDWVDGQASALWSDENLSCPDLRQAFKDFVSIVGEERRLIPGAYVNLLWRLNSLKTFLDNFTCEDETVIMNGDKEAYLSYTEYLTKGYLNNALRDQLKMNVQTCKDALAQYAQYPQAYGIPSGSSFLQWDGAAFQAAPEAFDGWVPATQYCYMPALYYYSNSTVSTSYSGDIYEQYPGKTTWDEIRALYTAGKMVTKSTRAVALDTPLQFACGMLVATVQATVNPLRDRENENQFELDLGSHEFPVTGMVIGGQFEQHYDFTPVTDDATQEVLQEKYMFDTHVSGVYVNTEQSAAFRTLVLPTPLERDVYFYLELRNDSGKAFKGADGVIPAGSRFYLAGKIPAPSEDDIAAGVNRVFMQDRYTQITCKITSLENAYLCIPQMGNPELQLGVQTKTNWIFSSSYVVLG